MKQTLPGQEVVQLLLQFCKEHGMIKTYHSLKEESNMKVNFLKDPTKFQQAFRHGNWDIVLEEMNELTLSRPLMMDFLEHLVFELCEAEEYDLARYIIKDLLIKKRLNDDHPERVAVIQEIVNTKKFSTNSYYKAESKQQKRDALLKRVLDEVKAGKPDRLIYILSKGIQKIKEEENIKSGETYDMFKDSFLPFEDLVDQIPTRISKTVRLSQEMKPTSISYSPNGQYMFVGMFDGFIEVWSAATKSLATDITYQEDEVFMQHECEITSMQASADASILIAADSSRKINIWRIDKGTILRTLEKAHNGLITKLILHQDGEQLVSASEDIKIWGLKSGRKLIDIVGHEGLVTDLKIYQKEYLLSSSLDGSLRIWSLKSGKEKHKFRPFDAIMEKSIPIVGVDLLPNDRMLVCSAGNLFLTIDQDGRIHSKGIADTKELEFSHIVKSPHNSYGYVTTKDNYLFCYDLASMKLITFMKVAQTGSILSVLTHPHKNMLTILKDSSEFLFLEP